MAPGFHTTLQATVAAFVDLVWLHMYKKNHVRMSFYFRKRLGGPPKMWSKIWNYFGLTPQLGQAAGHAQTLGTARTAMRKLCRCIVGDFNGSLRFLSVYSSDRCQFNQVFCLPQTRRKLYLYLFVFRFALVLVSSASAGTPPSYVAAKPLADYPSGRESLLFFLFGGAEALKYI